MAAVTTLRIQNTPPYLDKPRVVTETPPGENIDFSIQPPLTLLPSDIRELSGINVIFYRLPCLRQLNQPKLQQDWALNSFCQLGATPFWEKKDDKVELTGQIYTTHDADLGAVSSKNLYEVDELHKSKSEEKRQNKINFTLAYKILSFRDAMEICFEYQVFLPWKWKYIFKKKRIIWFGIWTLCTLQKYIMHIYSLNTFQKLLFRV